MGLPGIRSKSRYRLRIQVSVSIWDASVVFLSRLREQSKNEACSLEVLPRLRTNMQNPIAFVLLSSRNVAVPSIAETSISAWRNTCSRPEAKPSRESHVFSVMSAAYPDEEASSQAR